MTTLPPVTLENGDAAAPVSSSVVRQIVMRVWWVVCLLPALVLVAVATGR
jgi:hypothetical protein